MFLYSHRSDTSIKWNSRQPNLGEYSINSNIILFSSSASPPTEKQTALPFEIELTDRPTPKTFFSALQTTKLTMCTCRAYTYRWCRYGHAKFESASVCLAARLCLRSKCQERIINGNPDVVRDFPVIDEVCAICEPEKAKLMEDEKKWAERLEREENARRAQEKRAKEKERLAKEAKDADACVAFAQPSLEVFPHASDFELPETQNR